MTCDTDRIEEVKLLRAVANADRASFEMLYDRYANLLYSVACKILGDPKEAEDVIQEVFVQVWFHSQHYQPQLGKPISWMMTITRNKAYDFLRSKKRHCRGIAKLTEAQPEEPLAAAEELGIDQKKLLTQAIRGLPECQRTAIKLAFFSGWTQQEISTHCRKPLGTVKARIRRGMLRLRIRLQSKHFGLDFGNPLRTRPLAGKRPSGFASSLAK